ncbi:DUF5943 domain-containing protein [Inquilinus sp. CA228]|uniref:DUF5943 domain-containing protein n=1 Tax=Inquilinus sp. CA228 TaxID=3455609 RepID=UPI003F8D39AD
MAAPEVPIDVDPETGIWRTDDLPMVYLPRHFLVNNHRAVEAAMGIEPYRAILRQATEASAVHWCAVQARSLGLDPEQTVRRYFQRLSQRGWGRFEVEHLDAAGGQGRIALSASVFALEYGTGAGRPVCYMFEGFMTGALRHLLGDAGATATVGCEETQCAAQGHEHCLFEFGVDRPA